MTHEAQDIYEPGKHASLLGKSVVILSGGDQYFPLVGKAVPFVRVGYWSGKDFREKTLYGYAKEALVLQ